MIGNQTSNRIVEDTDLIRRLNTSAKGDEKIQEVTTDNPSSFNFYENEINDNEWILLDENQGILISIEEFYPNNSWHQMHELLQKENHYMPNIEDIVNMSRLLLENKARYADGTPINPKEQKRIFNEIYEVRDPWRSEYVDARFEQRADGLYILSNHIIKPDNSLKSMKEENLEDTLMKDKTPGIDLLSWLNDPNKHSLPEKNIKKGKYYYGFPKKDAVAGFDASSDGAGFGCNRGPQYSDASLGVRKKILRK